MRGADGDCADAFVLCLSYKSLQPFKKEQRTEMVVCIINILLHG